MTVVVTFVDYRPSPRYDGNPWTAVNIEEGTTSDGPWALLEQIAISPVDADPENPDYRNFTTQLGTAVDLWYRLTFVDADGDEGLPTYPVQNSSASRPVYATVEELAQLLKVRAADRHAALLRVLEESSAEIDSEIGTVDITGAEIPYGNPPALVSGVCLDRAVEHWKQQYSPFGIIGIPGETETVYTARDTWDRHAHKLQPLKADWGLA